MKTVHREANCIGKTIQWIFDRDTISGREHIELPMVVNRVYVRGDI